MGCVSTSPSKSRVAMSRLAHLSRRFFGSLSQRSLATEDRTWAISQLLPAEAALWEQLSVEDRRHSIAVARRFVTLAERPSRAEVAGALLHDVGKARSNLGTFSRVLATVVGPRTSRFRLYHDHEALGIEMLRGAGSDPATIALLDGTGAATQKLRVADEI